MKFFFNTVPISDKMSATSVKMPTLGFSVVAALVGVASCLATTVNTTVACPPFNNGTFTINAFQLYPENAKFDPVRCQVYFGYVYRSTQSQVPSVSHSGPSCIKHAHTFSIYI